MHNVLQAVDAVGPSDVWAVGHYQDFGNVKTLVEHWNGSVWSIVPSPNGGEFTNGLLSVAALGPNDVWAVGNYNVVGAELTLVEHLQPQRLQRSAARNSRAQIGNRAGKPQKHQRPAHSAQKLADNIRRYLWFAAGKVNAMRE